MPRISDEVLDTTFYLYANREDAENGRNAGGTGFFVNMRCAASEGQLNAVYHIYAVSNWHVVRDSGNCVIRLNTKDGQTDIIETEPGEWEYDPNGDDLVIIELSGLSARHQIKAIPIESMLTSSIQLSENIGIGDDVFMVGRFIEHDGGITNAPSVRFGNISVMPRPVKQPNNNVRDTFCLDMHSRTGYSGSPVFVYRTPATNFAAMYYEGKNSGNSFFLLLGIHCGQFPEELPIKGSFEKMIGRSGMTLAIPAQRIIELLNAEKFRRNRELVNQDYPKHFPITNSPIAESADISENSNHREDFNNLLDAAVRGKQ